MKIEMGESLILSWLRHVKLCQTVQLNWKPSTASWTLHNTDIIENLMTTTSQFFAEKHGLTIFKNNQTYTQLLQQGEIDVIGLRLKKGRIANLYGVDVAFHEGGLNYGGVNATVERVLKKLVRTAMIIVGYFDMTSGKIVFASPKIYQSLYEPLKSRINELNTLMKELGLQFEFKVYANVNFQKNIFDPVIKVSKNVADTSELFMRSIQMYQMFEHSNPTEEEVSKNSTGEYTRTQIQTDKNLNQPRPVSKPENTIQKKIGVLVRDSFEKLAQDDQLHEELVEWLQEDKYSKNTFDVNYAILKKVENGHPHIDQRSINGYPRYWSKVLKINGEQYFLCNDWYERNRPYFVKWVDQLENSDTKQKKKKYFGLF